MTNVYAYANVAIFLLTIKDICLQDAQANTVWRLGLFALIGCVFGQDGNTNVNVAVQHNTIWQLA